jgi:hypothetical protein
MARPFAERAFADIWAALPVKSLAVKLYTEGRPRLWAFDFVHARDLLAQAIASACALYLNLIRPLRDLNEGTLSPVSTEARRWRPVGGGTPHGLARGAPGRSSISIFMV